jgi:hypothetical protein
MWATLTAELQVPGVARGQCRQVSEVRRLQKESGLGGPPTHSRLKADRGLHPGPAQRLPVTLNLQHRAASWNLGLDMGISPLHPHPGPTSCL